MSEAFKEAQDRWCENLISDADLCDAVAVVGPECQRVPFIRAHLATISKPLKAALYGEFREGQTRELVLKDVTVDAFDVIIRSAYHLEPNLTPQKALHALKAAKLWMIDDLEKYCWHYLQHLVPGSDCTLILQTMTESLKLSLDLPEEVQHTYWSNILAQSTQVVQSPFFIETHGLIIARLIKLDEFDVDEGTLWARLLEWSAVAIQKPELLGPFADATPCQPVKRAKPLSDDSCGMGPSELAQQGAILRLMSKHIRFAEMSQPFFVDRARNYLDREESDAVMDYFLLGRKPEGLIAARRGGLKDTFDSLESLENFERKYKKKASLVSETLTFEFPVWVSQVEISLTDRHSGEQPLCWSATGGTESVAATLTRGASKSTVNIRFVSPYQSLFISFPLILANPGMPRPKVKSITVHGKKARTPIELANRAVEQLSRDLFVTPALSRG